MARITKKESANHNRVMEFVHSDRALKHEKKSLSSRTMQGMS